MSREHDYVLRTVEERGVRFVRLWFTDILGMLKSFAITPAELETAFEEGMRFDGSAIDGFSRRHESRDARPTRPEDIPDTAMAGGRDRGGPDVLRHHHPRG